MGGAAWRSLRADCIGTLLTARRDGHDDGQPRKDETLGDTFRAVAKGLLMPHSNSARGLNCPDTGFEDFEFVFGELGVLRLRDVHLGPLP